MQLQDINASLSRLENEVKRLSDAMAGKSVSKLWSVADIAKYAGVSRPTVRAYISHPTFPQPIILPSTTASPHPKWNSDDVETWVLSFQQNKRKKKLGEI